MIKSIAKTIVITLSFSMVIAGLGCIALSRQLTPGTLDKKSVEYVVESGVADANEYKGYANLYKVEKLELDVDFAHDVYQFVIEQAKQKDIMDYGIHKKVVVSHANAGRQREELLFGEKGLLSLGLSLAGFGTLTGFVGLARKRPGDVTREELDQVVTKATGKTLAELAEKNQQLIEVVKGVHKFMETYDKKDPSIIKDLKMILNDKQEAATRVAVAGIKSLIPKEA